MRIFMHACGEEEMGGGEVQKDLTSLSVSCAICPDGLTSKLFVSSDFLPPLQLAKFTAVISRSKETGEINFSFDAMIRWAWLRCTAVAALRCAYMKYGRMMTFVPTWFPQPWRCVCILPEAETLSRSRNGGASGDRENDGAFLERKAQ